MHKTRHCILLTSELTNQRHRNDVITNFVYVHINLNSESYHVINNESKKYFQIFFLFCFWFQNELESSSKKMDDYLE